MGELWAKKGRALDTLDFVLDNLYLLLIYDGIKGVDSQLLHNIIFTVTFLSTYIGLHTQQAVMIKTL